MKTLKAAVIGMGGISPVHTRSLEAIGVPITAVCDTREEVARAKGEELGVRAYTSFDEMLEAGGFDILHICLPHFLHAPVAIKALEKGIHVLCEKPMATTLEDAEKMQAAAEKSSAFLGIIFQNRYSPGASLIKETLESGELGEVKKGWLRVTWNRDESYYRGSDWKGKWKTEGGGVLINQSIHTFDLVNYLLGSPTAVSASTANRANPTIEVEDTAEGVITYGETLISFFVINHHPYDAPVMLELICEHGKVTLTGEDAVISWNDGHKKNSDPNTEAQPELRIKSSWGDSHIKQIRAFYESVASGKPPEIDGKEGMRTQMLINGIYKASEMGQKLFF